MVLSKTKEEIEAERLKALKRKEEREKLERQKNEQKGADFMGLVATYQAVHGGSKSEAMRRVSLTFPEAHQQYLEKHNRARNPEPQDLKPPPAGMDFEALVDAHMLRWGTSKAVAMQKVQGEYPAVHRAWIAKKNPDNKFLNKE